MPLNYLEKEVVKTKGGFFQKWCACCGRRLKDGEEIIRLKSDDSSKLILRSHLLSWLTEEPSDKMTFTVPKNGDEQF